MTRDMSFNDLNNTINKIKKILMDRSGTYDTPENSFPLIALLWGDYLGIKLSEDDVCVLLTLMKFVRHKNNKKHSDSMLDAVGYTIIAATLGGLNESRQVSGVRKKNNAQQMRHGERPVRNNRRKWGGDRPDKESEI